SVLRRPAAPPDVMTDQIRHLIKMSERPNVTVRVLPLHAAIENFYIPVNSFSVYRFADPADPEIVALETVTSDLHFGDEEDDSRYRLVLEKLRAAAHPPEASVTFLTTLTAKQEGGVSRDNSRQ